jgi:hypothetical protein
MISEKILISVKREIRLQQVYFLVMKQVAFFTSEGTNRFINTSEVKHLIFAGAQKRPLHIFLHPSKKTGFWNVKKIFLGKEITKSPISRFLHL